MKQSKFKGKKLNLTELKAVLPIFLYFSGSDCISVILSNGTTLYLKVASSETETVLFLHSLSPTYLHKSLNLHQRLSQKEDDVVM